MKCTQLQPLIVFLKMHLLLKLKKCWTEFKLRLGRRAGTLELKVNARVMLAAKVDEEDRLVNGQLGTVKHFQKDQNWNVLKIYVAFDDCEVDLKVSKRMLARRNLCVSMEKAEANVKIWTNKDSSPTVTRTQFPLMLAWDWHFKRQKIVSGWYSLSDRNSYNTRTNYANVAYQYLSQFQFLHNRSEDKFPSISVGYRGTVRINFLWWNARKVICFKVIILGDFNVNALEKNSQVKQVLSKYMQVVTESTQISGSLLDHIFIRKQINQVMVVQNMVITTYFQCPCHSFSDVADEKWLVFLNYARLFLRNTFVKAYWKFLSFSYICYISEVSYLEINNEKVLKIVKTDTLLFYYHFKNVLGT